MQGDVRALRLDTDTPGRTPGAESTESGRLHALRAATELAVSWGRDQRAHVRVLLPCESVTVPVGVNTSPRLSG